MGDILLLAETSLLTADEAARRAIELATDSDVFVVAPDGRVWFKALAYDGGHEWLDGSEVYTTGAHFSRYAVDAMAKLNDDDNDNGNTLGRRVLARLFAGSELGYTNAVTFQTLATGSAVVLTEGPQFYASGTTLDGDALRVPGQGGTQIYATDAEAAQAFRDAFGVEPGGVYEIFYGI